jgi:hypothetical protein
MNEDLNNKQITIIFCVPGNRFSDNFLKCWTNLFVWCINNNINPILSNHYNSNVYYVRNLCLGADTRRGVDQNPWDGKVDYDYIMWIDSDIFFIPQQLQRLIDSDKDIVSGIYKMHSNKAYATVESWDDTYYTENGTYEFLTEEHLIEKKDTGAEKIFPVAYTGLGFMLIKKGVFEKLKYPWFRPEWTEYGKGVEDFTSEDVGFCINAKKAGFNIFVNSDIRVGHEKSCIL